MNWQVTTTADSRGRWMADRHYSRKTHGAPTFTNPGDNVVLITPEADALWVSYRPQFVKFFPLGVWVCTLFRNESNGRLLSSELIREAVAATRYVWGKPSEHGMMTLIDTRKTKPKRDPGYCYIKAGFRPCGRTRGGLVALQLLPDDMPPAEAPIGAQLTLEGIA